MEGILGQRSTPRAIRAATILAALITLATLVATPLAVRQVGVDPVILPMYATAALLVESLTAYFLLSQFRTTREPFLAALGGAYVFVALLAASQIAALPGMLSEPGPAGAELRCALWIWLFRHGGFPVLVLLALRVYSPDDQAAGESRRRSLAIALMLFAPLLALAFAMVLISAGPDLPALIDADASAGLAHTAPGYAVIVLNVVALLACLRVTRLRELLSLWLAIALFAGFADAVLTLTAGARFSLGWYAARALSLLSSLIVLGLLVWEISQLHRRLERAHRELAERAIRDPLTGALNRGYLIEQFPREVRRALRERAPLSLLMLDVDYFKVYNDAHGHQQGDRCLIDLVGAIASALQRPGDYVARYGGEEFAVVLAQTDGDGALRVAQSVRAAIAALAMPREGFGPPYVTVSIGLATLDPVIERFGADELIRRADVALYAAKHAGRDSVRVYGPDAAPPDAAARP